MVNNEVNKISLLSRVIVENTSGNYHTRIGLCCKQVRITKDDIEQLCRLFRMEKRGVTPYNRLVHT
ncbi:hypothetical protein D3C84_1017880 [compost metagenome]